MFSKSAHIYDIIYSFKDYESEAARLRQMISTRHPEARSVLDVGCGTSEHHRYLNADYLVDGIDLDENFVRISQKKNPHSLYTKANMKGFDLKKEYDVLLCLFSSIGYLLKREDIISALKCFHKHLKPGGLLIAEPWFTPENWTPGKVNMMSGEKEGIKYCRMSTGVLNGDISCLNFHYLVGSAEDGVSYFEEEHKLRLTTKEEMMDNFKAASFEVSYEEEGLMGRGMYYGRK